MKTIIVPTDFSPVSINAAHYAIEMVDGKYIMSEVTLMPVLTIPNQAQMEKALKVRHKAEEACLISNPIKSRII